jgi:large subunit ribosomal protein L22
MEIKAQAKHIRMSPRKVRVVVDVVRGLEVSQAIDQLKFINKKAAQPIIKLLNSAVANAINNYELEKNNLYIKEIRVDEGTTLDRWMPRARGRATPIRKRTSHINVVLSELVASGKTGAKKQKIAAPVKLGSKAKEDDGVKIKGDKEKTEKTGEEQEKGKQIYDPRMEGKDRRARIEGKGRLGSVKKMFQRKSG